MTKWLAVRDGHCPDCREWHPLHVWASGAMDLVHGNYELICRLCTLKRQRCHAAQAVARLADIDAEIAAVMAERA